MKNLSSSLSNYSPKAITDTEWESLLEKIGAKNTIPTDYKEFLYKYNGDAFNEYVLNDTTEGCLIVSCFYPLVGKNQEYSIMYLIECAEDEDDFEDNFLIIADDPGGNYYLLNMNKIGNGEIHFWCHDGLLENGRTTTLLFNNFTDFINSMEVEI